MYFWKPVYYKLDDSDVKSRHDSADDGEILPSMPVIDPSELISRTFLMDKEDGQRHRA
jgi:hypothetical protein